MALPRPETPHQVSDQDWVVQLENVTQIAFTSHTCSNLFCLVYYRSLSLPRQTSCASRVSFQKHRSGLIV